MNQHILRGLLVTAVAFTQSCLLEEGAVDPGTLETTSVDGSGSNANGNDASSNGNGNNDNATANDNSNDSNTNSNGNTNSDASAPASITFIAGAGQAVLAGEMLPIDPAVRVLDGRGEPAGGVTIDFVASTGGGSVASAQVVTDVNGEAATQWTLGSIAGTNTLTASTRAPVLIATVDATGIAGETNSIVAGTGVQGQTAVVGNAVPVAPSVTLLDASGNPRAGVTVTFTPSGDGTVSAATATSNGSGVAAIASWTLGTAAGAQSLTVTAEGAGLTVNATATPDAPASITLGTGVDGQSATVGTAVAVAPSVVVEDQYGNPTPSRSVTFAVSGGAGSVSGGTAVTDGAGVASAGSWTLGTAAGANALTVSVASITETIDATALAGVAAVLRPGSGVDGQSAGLGSAVSIDPFVIIEDEFGNPVAGTTVSFSVTVGGGAIQNSSDVSDANGIASAGTWTLGGSAGANELTASAGLLSTTIGATATVLDLVVLSGNRQTAEPNVALAAPLVVKVSAGGVPQAGVTVSFSTSGDGSFRDGAVSTNTVVTDGSGQASITWVMGSSLGLTVAEANVSGASPVEFQAAATRYDIVLDFETPPSAVDREAFENAEFIWEATITSDAPDVTLTSPCVGAGSLPVDDLYIWVTIEPDDGEFGRLGSAGPCRLRQGELSPVAGTMTFDSADTARLAAGGRLVATILHEMGHVIGVGTLWPFFNLLENRSTTGDTSCTGVVANQDTRFIGSATVAEWQAFDMDAVGNVPVENDTTEWGCGSLDSHFRESTFGSELMTPLLTGGAPFSRLTIASLADFGFYTVSYALAEPYAVPSGSPLFDERIGPREWCDAPVVWPVRVEDDVVVLEPLR